MFSSTKKNPTLRWVNCLSGARGSVDQFPFRLPAGSPTPQLEVSPAPQGLTLDNLSSRPIMLLATSLPELGVDLSAAHAGLDDVAVGDLLGSHGRQGPQTCVVNPQTPIAKQGFSG